MKNPEAVLVVKFNSTFDAEELSKAIHNDLETFRNVPGLIQKYYVAEEQTGALGGIYIFETENARSSFWKSDLAKSIPTRYGVVPESLRVEQFEMAVVLNDELLVK
jgi:hypothetical protein